MSSDKNRDECELAIKKTLAYRSIFKYPLTTYQLKTFLVSNREFKNKIIDEALEHLLHRGFIKEKTKKFYLPGIKTVDWLEKKKLADKIVRRNEGLLKLIGKIPWVKMIAITGSVAAVNPNENSDLDVFIISAKNRVWTVRLFVTLVLKVLNKFPKTDGEKGKICTNLFIDEKSLFWDEKKRNLYIAHDIVLMHPIINKEDAYLKFLASNTWVSDYFPHFAINKLDKKKNKFLFSSSIVDFIEEKIMNIQMNHMRAKQTTEIITKNMIHFNKNDNCQKILEFYEKVLTNRNIF